MAQLDGVKEELRKVIYACDTEKVGKDGLLQLLASTQEPASLLFELQASLLTMA